MLFCNEKEQSRGTHSSMDKSNKHMWVKEAKCKRDHIAWFYIDKTKN